MFWAGLVGGVGVKEGGLVGSTGLWCRPDCKGDRRCIWLLGTRHGPGACFVAWWAFKGTLRILWGFLNITLGGVDLAGSKLGVLLLQVAKSFCEMFGHVGANQ